MFCVFATKAWSIKKTKQILPWKIELLQLDAILLSLRTPPIEVFVFLWSMMEILLL